MLTNLEQWYADAALRYAKEEMGREKAVVEGVHPNPDDFACEALVLIKTNDEDLAEFAMLIDGTNFEPVEDSLEADDYFANGGKRNAS